MKAETCLRCGAPICEKCGPTYSLVKWGKDGAGEDVAVWCERCKPNLDEPKKAA